MYLSRESDLWDNWLTGRVIFNWQRRMMQTPRKADKGHHQKKEVSLLPPWSPQSIVYTLLQGFFLTAHPLLSPLGSAKLKWIDWLGMDTWSEKLKFTVLWISEWRGKHPPFLFHDIDIDTWVIYAPPPSVSFPSLISNFFFLSEGLIELPIFGLYTLSDGFFPTAYISEISVAPFGRIDRRS
jgi:hypothetical protein